ncbi:hypothetical protein NG798_24620 [Ancylothrix sp. C2]|uniref:hypothetical protein n=1 Tax=Ancylothrix sp. D3o TaxID=2953691 RepID=UPI0021BA6900|nr:hypothetical protein [Ancylothrix sp. D3o]MCT7952987.1 hypothetical protein [Ancylothrix sp. D3o]
MNIDPRHWNYEAESSKWWTEPLDIALTGSPAYCQRFFAELFNEFPVLVENAVFLRWSFQPEWIYAVFNVSDNGFGVQIDTDNEYIVVWGPDGQGQAEYSDWNDDLVASAITHIRNLMCFFEKLN